MSAGDSQTLQLLYLPYPNGGEASKMKPLSIWSLFDMLRFHAHDFSAAISEIATAATFLQSYIVHGPVEGYGENRVRKIMTRCVTTAKPGIEQLPLSPAVKARCKRLFSSTETGSLKNLHSLMNEVQLDLVNDLEAHCFIMIRTEGRSFYENDISAFGQDVQNEFSEAGQDIAAASRCYALEEWTACVMHLMRVVEIGLKWMARNVGLPPKAYELENWKTIIDQIDMKVKELEKVKKSKAKNVRIKALSEAAVQFRYFKDAWRNHALHAHEHYDNKAAKRVWDAVEAFLQTLASVMAAQEDLIEVVHRLRQVVNVKG